MTPLGEKVPIRRREAVLPVERRSRPAAGEAGPLRPLPGTGRSCARSECSPCAARGPNPRRTCPRYPGLPCRLPGFERRRRAARGAGSRRLIRNSGRATRNPQQLHHAVAQGVAHGLGTVVQVELLEDVAQVELDRVLADVQLLARARGWRSRRGPGARALRARARSGRRDGSFSVLRRGGELGEHLAREPGVSAGSPRVTPVEQREEARHSRSFGM